MQFMYLIRVYLALTMKDKVLSPLQILPLNLSLRKHYYG